MCSERVRLSSERLSAFGRWIWVKCSDGPKIVDEQFRVKIGFVGLHQLSGLHSHIKLMLAFLSQHEGSKLVLTTDVSPFPLIRPKRHSQKDLEDIKSACVEYGVALVTLSSPQDLARFIHDLSGSVGALVMTGYSRAVTAEMICIKNGILVDYVAARAQNPADIFLRRKATIFSPDDARLSFFSKSFRVQSFQIPPLYFSPPSSGRLVGEVKLVRSNPNRKVQLIASRSLNKVLLNPLNLWIVINLSSSNHVFLVGNLSRSIRLLLSRGAHVNILGRIENFEDEAKRLVQEYPDVQFVSLFSQRDSGVVKRSFSDVSYLNFGSCNVFPELAWPSFFKEPKTFMERLFRTLESLR